MKWADNSVWAAGHIWSYGNTRLEIPDIDPKVAQNYENTLRKTTEGFPHADFISIMKVRNDVKKFKWHGRKVIGRTYGIGVLTNGGTYFYSELVTKFPVVSSKLIKIFKRMLLYPYRIDEETLVVMSDNIREDSDPVSMIFDIIKTVNPLKIAYRNTEKMIRLINSYFQYVKIGKGSRTTNYHKQDVIQELINHGKFSFLGDSDWIDKMSLMSDVRAKAYMNAALGILYLYSRWMRSKPYVRKKKMLEEEKLKGKKEEEDA